MKMRMKRIVFLALAAFAVAGCDPVKTETASNAPEQPPVSGGQESPAVKSDETPITPEETKPASLDKPVKTVDPPKVGEDKKLFHYADTKEAGLKVAKSTGGFVLLKFEADWCGPCQIMKREAFHDAGFAKTMEKAVVVPIDVDSETGQKLAAEYHADQIPKLVFLKSDGQSFGEIFGYMNVEWLQREVKNVFKKANYKG